MKKCVKVICTYLGARRPVFNNSMDMPTFITNSMNNEINIENGVNTDIILVNNDCGDSSLNSFIDKYNGTKTRNGKIIVEQRDNIGGSFGSYFDMFNKYSNEYDYWFFCEDDHIIFKEGYIKDFIEYLDSDEVIGYVCLAPITPDGLCGHQIHSGGGIGLTSTTKFKKVYGENSKCNFREAMILNERYEELQSYETKFNGHFIIHGGFELRTHPKYSHLPKNYETFIDNYTRYITEDHLLKEFIYNVGE